ncbi:MAG: hypothetical protein Q4F21_05495 [Lachnospiraceae bacterium]|nr:hypothetical protein [Lachnospiraceae bacterium]
MNKREWETMSDNDFEIILESSVSELPPDDIVAEVTPWKKSMNHVLVGVALNAITLNFWCLNYILPGIGTVLQLLGFRALRNENKWFKTCFIITIIRSIYFFPLLILNTTIMQSAIYATPFVSMLTIANLVLVFMEFIGLWRGFISIQQKAGLSPHAGGVVALIVWYAFMCVLALIQYIWLIIAGAMVIGYIFIICNLCKLSEELDEAGYMIHPAHIMVSDYCVVAAISVFLAIGFVCGYAFGGSYPMKWTKQDITEHTEVEKIQSHLIELGFPEDVLNDLTAEDIASCEGAAQVVVDVTEETVSDERNVTAESGRKNDRHMVQDTVYDAKELRITGVGVQILGEREQWIIFHHFVWMTDPGFYGTESIQLWPVYRDTSEGWRSAGEITGRVLYDKNGKTFVSDFYSLGSETVTSNTMIWGEQNNIDVFATFSMPRNSEHQRGYVAYPVVEVQDDFIISSWFNYTHQKTWFQYPAMTAMEKRMTNDWNDTGAFKTIQDALQFYPTDEGVELIN